MTVLALGERWSFAGLELSTYATMIRSIAGADDMPPLRGEDAAYTGLPGRRALPKVEDSRRIALGLWTTSSDAAGGLTSPTAREQARANLDDLKELLGRRHVRGSLVRHMPDGSTRSALAECVAIDNVVDPYDRELFGLVADFLLADPYLYGVDVIETSAIAASPTDVVLTSPGNRRGHRLLIDFTGPISNPRVANLSIDPAGDHYVELLVAVGAGLHAIVDVAAFTAENDGVNAIGSVRHSGALPFLEVDPGANTLRVTSMAPGGSVDFTFSPPYI